MPTGYRGRPRVVCSDQCYGVRRTILYKNALVLANAKKSAQELITRLKRWPEAFEQAVAIYGQISSIGPEVTVWDRENRLESEPAERAGESHRA